MKKLFLLVFLKLVACTPKPTVNELFIKGDTAFVIPENPTGWENWLKLTVAESLSNNVTIETSREVFQGKEIPKKTVRQSYQIPKGVSNYTIVEDYGQSVRVHIKHVQDPFWLRVEAPANDNRGNN